MYQVAIGEMGSFTIIDGLSISPPFKNSVCFFEQSLADTATDKIEIFLKGTPAQISTALKTIETIISKSQLNSQSLYIQPQYFRFQLEAGGDYFYTQISDPHLTSNISGYKTHYTGSLILSLRYTRPNYFTGDQSAVPLSGRFGDDLTSWFTLYNHTDYHPTHGNSVYIKPADLTSPLPAPLRFELLNTYGANLIKDIFVGLYHHPTNDTETPFFHNASDFSGGSLLMDPTAINDYYRRFTWDVSTLTSLGAVNLDLSMALSLGSFSYRPLVHLFNTHGYSDLYLSFKLQMGSSVLYTSEPAYADPNYAYILFPPVEIPPNQILWESYPHSMDFVLYAHKPSGGSSTLDIDQLLLLPLAQGANFLGFYNIPKSRRLIDDSFRGLHNVRYSWDGSELVSHIRQGGPLRAIPGVFNRLFFIMVNENNKIDPMRTADLRILQRETRRVL